MAKRKQNHEEPFPSEREGAKRRHDNAWRLALAALARDEPCPLPPMDHDLEDTDTAVSLALKLVYPGERLRRITNRRPRVVPIRRWDSEQGEYHDTGLTKIDGECYTCRVCGEVATSTDKNSYWIRRFRRQHRAECVRRLFALLTEDQIRTIEAAEAAHMLLDEVKDPEE